MEDDQEDGIINNNGNIPYIKKLDIYPHLKENILYRDNNCQHALTDKTNYCFTCKRSICPECNTDDHIGHLLIPKTKLYKYDPSIFNEVEKAFSLVKEMEKNKQSYLEELEESTNIIHKRLDEVKEIKKKEIEKMYNELFMTTSSLEKIYEEVKFNLKNYLENSQNFFCLGDSNNDTQNTIFLMNLELFNLLTQKNDELNYLIIHQLKRFEIYKNDILEYSKKLFNDVGTILDQVSPIEKIDNVYWDIIQRIKTYDDNNKSVQKNIFNIVKGKGNFEDLDNLVEIFNSKNKKGISLIFNQEFFLNNNNNNYNTNTNNVNSSTINNNINTKSGQHSKSNLTSISATRQMPMKKKNKSSSNLMKNSVPPPKVQTPTYRDVSSSKRSKLTDNYGSNNTALQFSSNNFYSQSNYFSKNTNEKSARSIYNKSTKSSILFPPNPFNNQISNVKLNTKMQQDFYSYSIIDMYNKLFSPVRRYSFDANERIYEDYFRRALSLKEYAKPVIGTNELLIYNKYTNTTTRRRVKLEKDIHGYNLFPEGLRHICINDNLYLTGGTSASGKHTNIVLCYDINKNELKRLNNMICPHAYHTMEYLDNYDCFLVVGGEKCVHCEIFDLFTLKWTRLPDLNFPRANVSVYFDRFTSEVYALFGLTNQISNQMCYSDVVEVLELNDITSGWLKIDYYKSATLDLKLTLVSVTPFTRCKLLICGVKNARNLGKIYALFLTDRNEIVRVTNKELEDIKTQENKMKKFSSGVVNLNK